MPFFLSTQKKQPYTRKMKKREKKLLIIKKALNMEKRKKN